MKFEPTGWLDKGVRRPSPNHYAKANAREIIVMHYTAGYDAASAVTFFEKAEAKASAHFVVGTDGAIIQQVSTAHCAWHAGYGEYDGRPGVNRYSIGIEIVNPGYHFRASGGGYLNWQRKPISAARLAPFPGMVEAKDPWVGSAPVFWPEYPDKQLDALEDLSRALLAAYPSLRDIVGHRDVDGVRKLKVDPGPAFPMRRFKLPLDHRGDDAPAVTMRVNNPGATVNVRGGPAQTFDTLAWGPLDHGDQVERIGGKGEWYVVRKWIEGTPREGWVYARYLVPG